MSPRFELPCWGERLWTKQGPYLATQLLCPVLPPFASLSSAEQTTHRNFSLPTSRRSLPLRPSYLHDPIPVVTRGHLEKCEEGHPKVLEGGVAAHALAGVLIIAY